MSYEGIMQDTRLAEVNFVGLGDGNRGGIGPTGLTVEVRQRLAEDIRDYEVAADDVWGCVDGRLPATAEKQVAGGLVITNVAAELMAEVPDGAKLSDLIGAEAEADRAAGLSFTVHGDERAGRAGCGANKLMRQVLISNYQNIAVMAPLAWSVMQALAVDQYLQPDAVSGAIMTGQQRANDEAFWDVTPEDVADLIEAHGGQYVTLEGVHAETVVRVDLDHGAFDKASFMHDHGGLSAFALSLREYADLIWDRYGDDHAAAADHLLRATLFNLGVCKELGDPNLMLAIVQPVQA